MSDEEIEQVALSDRDNPLLTDEEFEAFERVPDAQLPARPVGSFDQLVGYPLKKAK